MRDYFDWSREAACVNIDTSEFFPEEKSRSTQIARKTCETCPVKKDCVIHAIIYNEQGYWGGQTEKFRKGMSSAIRPQLILMAKIEGVFHPEMVL